MPFSISPGGILKGLTTGGILGALGDIAPEAAMIYGGVGLLDQLLTGQTPLGQIEGLLGFKHGALGAMHKHMKAGRVHQIGFYRRKGRRARRRHKVKHWHMHKRGTPENFSI